MTDVNRQWIMTSRPKDMVSRENFSWQESPMPEPGDGEFLVRNLYLSFDPTMRVWMNAQDSYLPAIQIGEVMRCFSVAQVVKSNHPDYAAGELVNGGFGWQDYAISNGAGPIPPSKLHPGIDPQPTMSVLGMTGLTGYFGMLDVGEVKPGDAVLVSGAAGATGSVAAQIGRIKGARVVGMAGGEEKCRWLSEVAGLDGVIDYKSEKLSKALRQHFPKGIDLYFDNVGGPTLDAALAGLALGGRVVLCGAISGYNSATGADGLKNYANLIVQRGRMQGFIILDYAKRYGEALRDLSGWVQSGDLKYQIDLQEGLENAPETFQRIFTGANQGKQLLKVADPT
ncbi:MAG: NADP-dependent oxidoreductase [Pseudomonadota bacterium]